MTYATTSARESRVLTLAAAIAAATAILLASAVPAHAYDLSRQDGSSSHDKVERGFVAVQGGLWFPGWDTFDDNHQTSLQFGGEFGVKLLDASDQHLFIVGGATFSPQTLEPHLDEREANVILIFAGVRYVPGTLCSASGVACPFIEVGFGLTWESAEGEGGHEPPDGDWTITAGVGYRFRLGRFVNLGVRIDLAYLEESYESQVGWISPTGFAGVTF